MQKQKVLLIGACSLLGNAFVQRYADSYQIIGTYSRLPSSKSCYKKIQQVQLDITKAREVNKFFQTHNFAVVLHTASMGNIEECQKKQKKAYLVNVVGTQNIVRAAARKSIKVIFISSSAVFAGRSKTYHETSLRRPRSFYGQTKKNAEDLVLQNSLNAVVRITLMYGWNNLQQRNNLATWIIDSLQQQKEVTLPIDRFTNPVWNIEVAKCLKKIIELNLSGSFQVAGADRMSRYQMGLAICKVFGLNTTYLRAKKYVQIAPQSIHGLEEFLSTSKMEQILKVKPLPMMTGLKRMKAQKTMSL